MNQKEKLDIKIQKWRMPLTGLISRLDTAEEGVNDFEDMPTETSQTEKQRERRMERNRIIYPKTVGNITKDVMYI